MKLMSWNQTQNQWSLVQVEVSFIPGLPQIHFLGQADKTLKESVFRLKSAFRQSGWEFPKTKAIVVNLTPKHIKKNSPGVELAVALAILKMTGQGPDWSPSRYIVYGDLGLNGEICFPDSGKPIPAHPSFPLLSGPGFEKYCEGFCLTNLKDLIRPEWREKKESQLLSPPALDVLSFTPRQAEVLEALAVGEHHALMAGSQGSGKSVVFDALSAYLRKPSEATIEFHETIFSKRLTWRPVARPHHTISPQSMVGGGVPPKPGEITRAHGGALLLDEMMHFKPQTLEVLREALSSQEVTVSRGLQNATFHADLQLVGATNLCPCGKWTPEERPDCGYVRARCHSTLQKLSGPLLDRIQGFFFFAEKGEEWSVSSSKLKETVQRAQDLQASQGRLHNRSFQESSLHHEETQLWRKRLEVIPLSSARRRQACVAWARTLADLDQQERIKAQHFERAFEQTIENYKKLIKWGAGSG